MVMQPQQWRQRQTDQTKISHDVTSHKNTQERVPAIASKQDTTAVKPQYKQGGWVRISML